jgi:hypothetical protein
MFETVTEAKQKSGFKGFTSRHFGPVIDADLARDGLRDISLVLIGLSCFLGIVGWYFVGPASLIITFAFAIPAAILRLTPSRLAASLLLLLTVINAILSLPRLFPWIFVLFALRGVQLAFGYHRLLKAGSPPSPQG